MEFVRLPTFFVRRASEMETVGFGDGSKTFQGSALPEMELFAEWSGNGLSVYDAKLYSWRTTESEHGFNVKNKEALGYFTKFLVHKLIYHCHQ